ncbi:RNA pseudouridylate synthase family protein [Synechococcus sp. BIOS-E4-1]|uniref:pseudouridine synthase family protein n=1 Tax=Synechococcus sp. BIOS-E4-1 TaxID=1400864 RepID=UPI00185F3649|nr:RNA pseudouridylate synthase family protein [Synechococcus sp. BIOS-E4-1]
MTCQQAEPLPEGWRAAALNQGWMYRDITHLGNQGTLISALLAERYPHSCEDVWLRRIAAGEIRLNGKLLFKDRPLPAQAELLWHRPGWIEPAIPDSWSVEYDDGDLLVINKPSGLPVMPGGGFLQHTLATLLDQRSRLLGEPLVPKPVHRLGRFTSGLQVCARQPTTRAALSRSFQPASGTRKLYHAWSQRVAGLEFGKSLVVKTDVVERPHALLGWVWGPLPQSDGLIRRRRTAHSELKLLDRCPQGDRLQVAITTGRPHQIRIHLAQLGSPLLGDPLYLNDQRISDLATPGNGGYRLHAWRLQLNDLHLCCEPPSTF